jgi:hypothetical protein
LATPCGKNRIRVENTNFTSGMVSHLQSQVPRTVCLI